MLFQHARTGQGVIVDSPVPKRAKQHFDAETIRLLRARTFAVYASQGVSIDQIAAAFRNIPAATIRAELAWLADQIEAEDDQ